eukprot:TRINITY_DN7869_c0_g1_i4.p1 TRINITY_DN7869_c0_g1~~TRINITY_DN7869_c0_g1_i4.p1  ORF type:complete len:731 (+),score=222.78 TRINITY_DN7869_c0_g1_i4:266-2194(+)
MVGVFCEKLGWWDFHLLISHMNFRLNFTVQQDLLPLMEISNLKPRWARALFQAGLHSPAVIAHSSVAQIEQILKEAVPFKLKNGGKSPRDFERMARLILQEVHKIEKPLSQPAVNPAVNALTSPPSSSSPRKKPVKIISVMDLDSFKEMMDKWEKKKSFAIVTESTTTVSNQKLPRDNHNMTVQGQVLAQSMSICWSSRYAYHVPLHMLGSSDVRWTGIKKILGRENSTKVGHGFKNQLQNLAHWGVVVKGNVMDPAVACWCLDPKEGKGDFHSKESSMFSSHGYSLEALSHTYAIHPNFPADVQNSCREAVLSWMLSEKLKEVLKAEKLDAYFENVEMPILRIIANMEYWGIGFDGSDFNKYNSIIERRMKKLEISASQIFKKKFDLGNPWEVARVLFDELGLPNSGRTVRPSGAQAMEGYSRNFKLKSMGVQQTHLRDTSKQVLAWLQKCHPHPLVDVVIQWRAMHALRQGYVSQLPRHVTWNFNLKMGRIHPKIDQTGSATGRIDFVPNLQTIPHPRDFHVENEPTEIALRKSFVAAPDSVLLSADYSQIELRIFAHFSQDAILLEMIRSGNDLFTLIASHWLGKDPKNISFQDREQSKRICYGMLYGMGAHSLMEHINAPSVEAAAQCLNSFKQKFHR